MNRIWTWPSTESNNLRPWWMMVIGGVWAIPMGILHYLFLALSAIAYGMIAMEWKQAWRWLLRSIDC